MDRLLDSFARAEALVAASAAAPTAADCRALAEAAGAMAADWAAVSGDASASKGVAEAAAGLEAALGAAAGGDPAPAAAARLALSLERGGIYRWVQLIRQGAPDAPGPRGRIAENALAEIEREGAAPIKVPLLSFLPPAAAGAEPPPSLAALVVVAAALPDAEMGPVVLTPRRLWLRIGRVELFADLSAPRLGGLVRARLREFRTTLGRRSRLYFLSQALFEAGFSVSLEGGRLEAVLEAGRNPLEQPAEPLLYAAAAAKAAVELTEHLGAYLKPAPDRERQERAAYLARLFAAEGEIPFLNEAAAKGLGPLLQAYRAREPEREAARARMNKALVGLGLGTFPDELPVGRRTVEVHYRRALEAAAARGEISLAGGAARRIPYDPVGRLAGVPAGPGEPALASASERFEPVGLLAEAPVWRAQWRLGPEDWLTLLMHFEGGRPARVLAERGSSLRRAPLPAAQAAALLKGRGLIAPAWSPRGPSRRAARPARGTRVWAADALGSPRPHAEAVVTYRADKALGASDLYATPLLVPSDAERLRKAAGFLITRGVPLAAALSAQAGPGLVLGPSRWTAGGLELRSPEFGPQRPTAAGPARSLTRLRLVTLREGDRVALDAGAGTLDVIVPEAPAAPKALTPLGSGPAAP